MSYAIGNVASLIAARNTNLNLSKTTAAKLEKLQLPGASSSSSSGSEDDKPSDNKALIVGALVVAGIAAFALRR